MNSSVNTNFTDCLYDNNPGPGKYDSSKAIKLVKSQAPMYSIVGKGLTNKSTDFTPGPGYYQGNKSNISNLKNNFSKSKRKLQLVDMIDLENSPGPGSYDVNNFKKIKPSNNGISFGKDRKSGNSKYGFSTPGPGNYSVKYINTAPSISIGKDQRNRTFVKETSDYNGPKYNLNFSNKTKICNELKFSKAPRFREKYNYTPGPGTYQSKSKEAINTKTGFSFGKSKFSNNLNNSILNTTNPGPGQYSCDFVINKLNKGGYSFGKCIKGSNQIKSMSITPGPGQYNDNYNVVKSSTVNTKFGKDLKIKDNVNSDIPGPGTYNNLKLNNSQSVIFSKDKKFKERKENSPGPGQYKIPCSIRDVNDYSVVNGNFDMRFKYI